MRVRGVMRRSMPSRSRWKRSPPSTIAVGHGDAAEELDERAVDGEPRVRVEHLVAGVHDGQQELADHGLAAGLDGDIVGAVGDAARAPTSAASASRSGAMPALGQ